MEFEVLRTKGLVGAEVRGVALRHFDEEIVDKIKDLLDRYSVLVFRDQVLTPQQQLDLTACFGVIRRLRPDPTFSPPGYPDILRISNIIVNDQAIGTIDAGQYWHSDLSVTANPPFRSTMYAIEVPMSENGNPLGDTMFSGTAEAYDSLPEDIRRRITDRRAIHDHHKRATTEMQRKFANAYHDSWYEHPVVRTHPTTGRKSIFVNEAYTTKIVGMDEVESDQLLQFIFSHIKREEAVYRHQWQVGDLVIWDDPALQHNAVADYRRDQRRLLYRATVDGA